jgi:hypothetical protein
VQDESGGFLVDEGVALRSARNWDNRAMRMVSDTQHEILAFVEACNRNRYEPTLREVDAWLESPLPRDAVYKTRRRQKPWTANLPNQWMKPYENFGKQLTELFVSSAFKDALRSNASLRARPDVSRWLSGEYRVVVEPAESAIAHLVRIGWLEYVTDAAENDDGRLQITPLGQALLRQAEIGEADEEQLSVVVLGRDDVLAYPQFGWPSRRAR